MSDPTARRGDNINALLNAMINDKDDKGKIRGWSWGRMKRFLFKRYRFGVRDQTIDAILHQLKDHGLIMGKPIRKRSNILKWFAIPPINIEYEKENKKGKEGKSK